MAQDVGSGGGRWVGGLAACLLVLGGPALALQSTTTATPSPTAAGPRTYTECLRAYANRPDAATTCARLFPATAPAASTPSTSSTAPGSTSTPTQTTQPVDITSQVNKVIDAWRNRPKPTRKPPTDPLAVIPGIQAACADYAGVPDRWRRCALDGWRAAGFTGTPPLVLQNPPVVASPPVQPPVTTPPILPPVVQYKPPVQTPAPLTPEAVEPEPVIEPPLATPQPSPAAIVPPTPPPAVVPPPPTPAPTPIWFWLVALVAVAAAGFGLGRLLNRPRTPRPAKLAPAPCIPEIALVADPGVVVVTPDGPPGTGLPVSLRFERAGGGEIGLDYPTLEAAP